RGRVGRPIEAAAEDVGAVAPLSLHRRYHPGMRWLAVFILLLAGCATRVPLPPMPPLPTAPARVESPTIAVPVLPHFRCDQGDSFDARFGDDSVELVFANREVEMLLRDAGG